LDGTKLVEIQHTNPQLDKLHRVWRKLLSDFLIECGRSIAIKNENFMAKVCRLDAISTEDIAGVLGQLAGYVLQEKKMNDFETWRR
jgi:hypothetical protein